VGNDACDDVTFCSETLRTERADDDKLTPGILELLEDHGIRLDTNHKDQHLLVSKRAIEQLIEAAELDRNDRVMEIGPGPGQITQEIARVAGQVTSIEIDTRFRPILNSIVAEHPHLEVKYGSALDVPWPMVDKVISNPPFSILEPMIEKFALAKGLECIVLVIGERYYSRVMSNREYPTRTSLITQAFFEPSLVAVLDADCFYPTSREGAVVMKLRRWGKKQGHFGMRLFASRLMRSPRMSVRRLLSDLIGENIDTRNLRNIDYKNIPSVTSLGIASITLNKSIGKLDNKEICAVIRAITSLRKRF
jgi:16S rRNA A1518/A1519 N6-dimethyltransferase RsmA/KsgA/DIM1 with predicted DNA glycosylase/AP lyase activity